jgi:hypothetical protein
MKKLFLTIREGRDAHHTKTLLATCDKRLIEKVASEINARLTGQAQQFGIADKPEPPTKKPGGN